MKLQLSLSKWIQHKKFSWKSMFAEFYSKMPDGGITLEIHI